MNLRKLSDDPTYILSWVVGDDADARYAYPSVRHILSGIRVVPRKNPSLCNERGFFYALNII